MDNLMLRRRLMMAAQGVWTTVTATTPFSVQNALKSKMRSLIQYGKMVQDGTPTPDAPVYPSINNGVVRAVHQSGLPLGYTLLDYVEANGTQYIDLDVSGNATFIGTAQSTTDSPTTSQVIVANSGASAGHWFGVQSPGAGSVYGKRWGFGATPTASSTINGTTKVDFEITFTQASQTGTVNDQTLIRESADITHTDWIAFAGNTTPTYGFIGKVWGLKVAQNDVLVRNLIPAKNASNLVGMYDLVSGQFFTNKGTGDFVEGDPVSDPVEIHTVAMVDPDLPAGYKRLTGINFDGNFHYETGEALTGDDVVTMTLDNLSTSGKNVFGSYNGANGKNFSLYIYGSSTSGSYFRFGDQLKRPKYGGTGRRTITFGAGGTSGFAEDVSIDPDEFTTPANTYIGMLPNSSSAAYTGDIVGSILVGARLEWIPCESDGGVIGYYERVNGTFIAPTGDGTPVSLGYDTTHLVPRVVGTPETLTVGGINLFYNDEEWAQGFFLTSGKVAAAGANRTFVMRCTPNTTYYWKHCSFVGGIRAFTVDADTVDVGVDGVWIKQNPVIGEVNTVYSATTGATAKWLCVCFGRNQSGASPIDEQWSDFMLSTAPLTADTPYQPYTAPQTATVPNLFAVGDYRDEVDVVSGPKTRRVGMKVLDGTEPFSLYQSSCWAANVLDDPAKVSGNAQSICSHYVWTTSSVSGMADGTFLLNGTARLCIKDSRFETAAQFRAELAAQYAQGTPVIVWYPLAAPTTESVAPQELSTVKGNNVIDATSDIAPFDVSVTYRARK